MYRNHPIISGSKQKDSAYQDINYIPLNHSSYHLKLKEQSPVTFTISLHIKILY